MSKARTEPHTNTKARSSDTHRRAAAARRKHVFKGIPIVPGIAIGRVRLKFRPTQVLSDRRLKPEEVTRELQYLDEAVRQAKAQLLVARKKVATEIGEVEASIFDAHIAILEDRSVLSKIKDQAQHELKPVEVVVSAIVEGYYQALSVVEDEHLRERAADIRDVGRRLLDNLHRLKNDAGQVEAEVDKQVHEGDIIFGRELLPSDIATLERRHVSGVITEAGSARGHCAIMLRALGTPTVMGLDGMAGVVSDGDLLIVDGSSGTVHVNPRKETVDEYRKAQKDYQVYWRQLFDEVKLPAETTDGVRIHLLANINQVSDLHVADLYRADGVGLLRTEFSLMVRSSFPDEDELAAEYRDIAKAAAGRPVTIRTMDIGSDKKLPYIKAPVEQNPALGRRSFRLAMELDEFQICQLRAILRASHHGDVRVMFPLVTSLEDVRMARRMVRLAMRQLDERGKRYNPDIQVGMMVEVPAAALSLEKYARDVQFFSVGTNDLVQYLCAADRDQVEVAHWYKGYNPGVLAVMRQVASAAEACGRPLTVCGEMAGDPFYTMFLIGIGVRQLSMSPPQIPLVKKVVRSINMAGAQRFVDRAMQLGATAQVAELFQTTVQQILGRDISAWTRE